MLFLSRRRRAGVTRVEALVLALLGFTICTLGVSCGVQEGASRIQCTNNMKQVVLAMHNYHDVYKRLPPLRSALNSEPADPANAALHFHLLPFIEQNSLYKVGLRKPEDTAEADMGQALLRQVLVSTYLCPSDQSLHNGYPVNRNRAWAATNYAANYQVFGVKPNGDARQPQYKLGEIPDRTENVIAFAEKYGGGQADHGSLWAHFDTTRWNQYAAFAVTNNGNWQSIPQFSVPANEADPTRPGTWHSQGCVVGLLDASARVISANVSPTLWQQLCSPDDGKGKTSELDE